MVDALDGYEEDGVVLDTTTEVVTDDGTAQRDTIAITRFSKLGLVDQLLHTVASPPSPTCCSSSGCRCWCSSSSRPASASPAWSVQVHDPRLLRAGRAPTRGWAVGLILVAMLAFAVDVQVGFPRFWTGIGVMPTIVGSWYLFEPLPGASLRPSWITLIAGIGGIMLTFIVGMPSMVRTRFATPTIGREWMIGEIGSVVERADPDGVVEVREARWRARTNRATPVERGDQIRVIAIDGVTLEVEPLDGAARDYREARHSS